jgi:hypothetical protein
VQQSLTKPPSEIKACHTQEITKCCCAGQGMLSLKAWVQKDSYMAGEMACIVLEVSLLIRPGSTRVATSALCFRVRTGFCLEVHCPLVISRHRCKTTLMQTSARCGREVDILSPCNWPGCIM